MADAVARGQLPAELDALTTALDDVWGQLQYPAAWESAQEHAKAVAAIDRFLQWHHESRNRTVVSTEEQFTATFTVAGSELRLSGRLDRLERDDDGYLVVVDLKTMSNAPSRREVAMNLQLATYRRLVSGAVGVTESVGAAELVQLRIPAGARDPGPKVQRQEATEEADGALDEALAHAVDDHHLWRVPGKAGPVVHLLPVHHHLSGTTGRARGDPVSAGSNGLTRQGICELFKIPFTDEQLDAITAPHAPAVVIAGAGSGKTALMSARVVWLVSHGAVTPDQVLGLTFTNKAAAELSARVRKALRLLEGADAPSVDSEPTVSTYHSYAASLLREYGLWAGYEPAAQLLTDAQRVQLAESVVRRAARTFPRTWPSPDRTHRAGPDPRR